MLSRFWKQVNGYIFGFRSGTRYSLSHNKIQLYHISSLLLNSGPLSNMISPPPTKTYIAFFAAMAMKRPLFPARRFAGGPGCHLLVQELRCILGRRKIAVPLVDGPNVWMIYHEKVNNGHQGGNGLVNIPYMEYLGIDRTG